MGPDFQTLSQSPDPFFHLGRLDLGLQGTASPTHLQWCPIDQHISSAANQDKILIRGYMIRTLQD